MSCGDNGQIACEGMGLSACDSEFSIIVNGKCESCGWSGQPCCDSVNKCRDNSKRTCVDHGNGLNLCEKCGDPGETCCYGFAGPYCDGVGVNCVGGTCLTSN